MSVKSKTIAQRWRHRQWILHVLSHHKLKPSCMY